MLISKFHKLIRNKFIWGAFAGLISLSMLGFFAQRPERRPQDLPGGRMLIYGEPVSETEYKTARFFVLDLGNRKLPDTEEASDELDQAVRRRLALLKSAERMGLRISDAEVARAIQADRAFANEATGQFDKNRYLATLSRGMRISPAVFEAYMRQEMLLRQLMSTAAATLWIPPADIDREIKRYTDVLAFEVASMDLETLSPKVMLEEPAARSYFDANQEAFRVPVQRSVKVVQWAVTNFIDQSRVSDMAVQDFYDMNIEDYAVTDTNLNTTAFSPLADVRSNIVAELARNTAVYQARRTAAQFSELLAPNEYNEPGVPFDQAAISNRLTVVTTALFTEEQIAGEVDAGYAFTKAAFELDPKSLEDYFSAPVVGRDYVYVIAFDSEVPSAIPPFETVSEEAMELATSVALAEARIAAGISLKERLTSQLMAGKSFSDAAKAEKLAVARYEGISAYTSTGDEFDDFSAVIGSLLDMQSASLSDLIETDAAALFVYVLNRAPGDFATIEMTRPAVKGEIQRMRMRQHFADWSEAIVREAITETAAAKELSDEEPDEESDAVETPAS